MEEHRELTIIKTIIVADTKGGSSSYFLKSSPANMGRWPNVGLLLATVYDTGPTVTNVGQRCREIA